MIGRKLLGLYISDTRANAFKVSAAFYTRQKISAPFDAPDPSSHPRPRLQAAYSSPSQREDITRAPCR